LARAGIRSEQPQGACTRRQGDRGRSSAVGDTHDARLTAAVLEELLDCVGEWRGLPEPAKMLLEFREASDRQRLADRTLEGAADEGNDCGRHALDRVTDAAFFCVFFPERRAI